MSVAFEHIGAAAIAVLKTANASEKAARARMVAATWKNGLLPFDFKELPPLRPSRPKRPELLEPKDMPKRRKGNGIENQKKLLHSIAHIELNAIDLAFDMVARFAPFMPKSFCDDWIKIGDDEARHFLMLSDRLKHLNCAYGDYPAHDGLWQSAIDTKDSLPARLAIVPMVLEARGLDVTPPMVKQFIKAEDMETAKILNIILTEEITHVEAGSRWFKYIAEKADLNPEEWFQDLVSAFFKGHVKPPFNDEARSKAGLEPSFYEPLAKVV